MTAAIAWLRAHKQFALIAGAILAVFTSGYCAGKRSVSQPAVHEVVQGHAKADAAAVVQQTVHAGPERITVTDYDVGPWAPQATGPNRGNPRAQPAEPYTAFCRPIVTPGQDRIIRRTVIERGPSVTETHAQAEVHEVVDRKLDLTVSPAMLVRSLALGVEDPFGDKKLHIEGGVMVTQHLGVRLGWTPANGLLKGLTPMAEVRF